MTNTNYPAPVKVNANDEDAIFALLEQHEAGTLQPADIKAFFDARAAAQLPAKPAHPRAGGHGYGHWGNPATDPNGVEIFAHQTPARLNIHTVSGQSFMLPTAGFKGAVWAESDAAGAVTFTGIGDAAPKGAYLGIAYKPGATALAAIEHQITGHVTGACKTDHGKPAHNHG